MHLASRSFWLCCVIVLATSAPTHAADYVRDIKPLLEHKCFACHGALKQQGSLRLDTGKSILAGGDSGEIVVPGNPEASYLIDVLTGKDGYQMPPASEGTPLSDDEIELVRSWIREGANIPEQEAPQPDPRLWWSYQPIKRPALLQPTDPNWCREPIDHFIAAQRDQRNLPVALPADKSTWLRRVYLDLIGLPPTVAEQQQFLADNSPEAYETVVDDLLARPQYGERWGRHWMDVWRYSDWYGSRGINEVRYSQRHIWRWRDWIVDSLNADQGYDQMIREMLAGDEIGAGDTSVLPATGYLGRNWYKFDRDVWLSETVERTGEAFLGLTFRCCRCHDHKFDPIVQQEYYQFRAIFEPHDVRTDPISALTGTQKDATLGQVLNDGIPLVYDKTADVPTYLFQRGDNRYPDKTEPLKPGVPASMGGTFHVEPVEHSPLTWYPMLRPELAASLLEKADLEIEQAMQLVTKANTQLDEINNKIEIRSQDENAQPQSQPELVFADDFSTPRPNDWQTVSGDWEYLGGKLVQSAVTGFATHVTKQTFPADVRIELTYRTLQPGTYRSVGFSYDYVDQGNSQDVYTSTGDSAQSLQAFHRIDGKQAYPQAGIVITPLQVGQENTVVATLIGTKLELELNGEHKLDYTLPIARREGKFALWVHQGAAEFLNLRITKLAESAETLRSEQQAAQKAFDLATANHKLATLSKANLQARIAAEQVRYLNPDSPERDQLIAAAVSSYQQVQQQQTQVNSLNGETDPATTESLTQTDADPGYPPLGPQFPTTSTGRRTALADWIASAENPRTARVAANHIWARHFGQPLVTTPENFGLNGRPPSHPDLLDWLAAELIEHNWQMKPLHRQLVLSSTYRMSSLPQFADESESRHQLALQTDAENLFFWRMNARRMEAEVVRDATLHLAGRLDLTRGGPELPETEGETVLRRSLYFRNTPNEKMPLLDVFDVADPNACYRRKESIVPHQSLAMMNSGLSIDSARAIAAQLAESDDFIGSVFETILSRTPDAAERTRCEQFLKQHAALLESTAATAFPAGGTAKTQPATDPAARARENLVHVLLLHNDFVTIR